MKGCMSTDLGIITIDQEVIASMQEQLLWNVLGSWEWPQ